ncbi:aminoacyl tRNA synthase complex-interacting multifunctional protein 1-like [Limanda limanda]|uniref:aminoacyl tRNA synthase complex-interacting multifunctional protein 1-like n=1 Tax=Limanda limanda TaxID=27771 RepID=UPI0029C850B6|nr:aminoacyl tRNA synthase complex-interacting multifunctional protein 1-like [Limanda limanda]
MGRSGELSDFQRGTVVGCHLCLKSVREISGLLKLPRSTVSSVILKWKRGGITTALPRSGRPTKLQEPQRRVLQRVALEQGLPPGEALGKGRPSVEALTAEFRSRAGASVSSRTVRRELREMGFRGRVSTYTARGGEKKQTLLSQEDAQVDVSRLDLRVGRILTVLQPSETESVCVKQVDVGEAAPRTVVSELAHHIPVDQMQNRMAVLLCNLRPAEMGGVVSQAMVMCACSPDKVELLDPPIGAAPGDRVTFQGFPGEPDTELDPKENVWEQIQPDLRTDAECVAAYRGAAFKVLGKGVCKSQTMSDSDIK